MKPRSIRTALSVCALVCAGCYTGLSGGRDVADDEGAGPPQRDSDADGGSGSGDEGGVPVPDDSEQIGFSGLRRLTANEYDNTIRDLLLDEAKSELLLPYDPLTPFDNFYGDQQASQALIEGADLLAADLAGRLVADITRREVVVGCSPSGPDDEVCMRSFVTRFGRRALRRPLADDEVDELLHGTNGGALDHAIAAGDFWVGVDSLLRTILQDPQFLYRVELGEPVPDEPGLYALSQFEIATRLSYLLWGAGPDDGLLDLAEAGGLADADAIRAQAIAMLDDPRAIDRVDRFHALWLGYEDMPFGGDLAIAMRAETRGLFERIVFDEQRPWQDLFRFEQTLVDDTLAEHYGMPLPNSDEPVWVAYDRPERRGLLAHGAFLSVGAKNGDTNVVRRGLQIRRQLLCQDIPPPPPTVDVDAVPPGLCKVDKSAAHAQGGCAGCHDQIDPVGFGLENFDAQGRWREYEPDNPDTPDDETVCEIAGEGNLLGVGEFHGPAQLGELAIGSGLLERCLVDRLYRFTTGRAELDDFDAAFIEHVLEQVGEGELRFDELVLEVVGHDAFRFRREEP